MIDLMESDDAGSSTAARRSAGPALTVDLTVDDDRWLNALPDAVALARQVALAVLGNAVGKYSLNISVVLSDDARVRDLNLAWRGIDKATNVLSFPTRDLVPGRAPAPEPGQPTDQPVELGDVIVARETVLREAVAQGKTPRDHLAHLIVHGILHLMGYDHVEAVTATRMETLETTLLAGFGITDPYG